MLSIYINSINFDSHKSASVKPLTNVQDNVRIGAKKWLESKLWHKIKFNYMAMYFIYKIDTDRAAAWMTNRVKELHAKEEVLKITRIY